MNTPCWASESLNAVLAHLDPQVGNLARGQSTRCVWIKSRERKEPNIYCIPNMCLAQYYVNTM